MRFLSAIVRVRTGQRFSDVTSGFRAFDRPVIELLAREHPVEYLADTVEALLIVRSAGFRVEVPISMRPRAAGVPSTRRFKLVINYLGLLIGILGSASRRARLRKDRGSCRASRTGRAPSPKSWRCCARVSTAPRPP
jgi:hypothetical protein